MNLFLTISISFLVAMVTAGNYDVTKEKKDVSYDNNQQGKGGFGIRRFGPGFSRTDDGMLILSYHIKESIGQWQRANKECSAPGDIIRFQ